MENVSAVARDSRLGPSWSLCVMATILASLGFSLTSWSADPARSRAAGVRPPRTAQQNSNGEANAQNALAEKDAAGEQTASVSAEELARQLPKHVHPKHPLVPALQMAYKSRDTLKEVSDYTAVFVKKELIGQGYITHSMDMKLRERPFGVYLRFQDPSPGRQVLYPAGVNKAQLLVQEPGLKGGLIGTIALSPTAPLAMSENRHPITEIGISNMLNRIIQQWELEAGFAETDVNYYPEAKLGAHPVRVIQTSHPTRRNQFKYHVTRLFLDQETLFPVRVDQYDWPAQPGGKPVQVELYMYSSVRTNVGVTDRDFDPRQYNMR
ncbi:MAG: hypothetical protein JWM11_587 [Planctomycetaceae bacterium]|nr:hypothetical protein [Planctomycetaceae bacterium]